MVAYRDRDQTNCASAPCKDLQLLIEKDTIGLNKKAHLTTIVLLNQLIWFLFNFN